MSKSQSSSSSRYLSENRLAKNKVRRIIRNNLSHLICENKSDKELFDLAQRYREECKRLHGPRGRPAPKLKVRSYSPAD